MTKKQLQDKYNEWNKSISKEWWERRDEIFHELQELSATKGDGHRWCSMEALVASLKDEIVQSHRASWLLQEYYKIEGKMDALRDLAKATENFKIN